MRKENKMIKVVAIILVFCTQAKAEEAYENLVNYMAWANGCHKYLGGYGFYQNSKREALEIFEKTTGDYTGSLLRVDKLDKEINSMNLDDILEKTLKREKYIDKVNICLEGLNDRKQKLLVSLVK